MTGWADSVGLPAHQITWGPEIDTTDRSNTMSQSIDHFAIMKSISASIVVLAAALLVLGGSTLQHSDTRLFLQVLGCGVGSVGLWGWIITLKSPERDRSA